MSSSSSIVYSKPFSIDSSSTISSDIKRHFTDSIQINSNNNKFEDECLFNKG